MSSDNACEWIEQMSTGLALVDAQLRLRWLNPALADLLDAGLRSAIGQPLAFWLRDPALVHQATRLGTERRAIHWRDAALRATSGREHRVDVALQPLDETSWLLEVHRLADSASAASPLSASLRGFAHEVKNPLAGLRGAAQLLQRRLEDADLSALAGLVIDEADRLAALADRLLHRDGASPWGSINLHELLERLTALLHADPRAPRVRHDYDPSVPDVRGDADQLHQALLNLAGNALQAGAGTLTLRTRIEHGVHAGDRLLRSALRVDVADDGTGVPAELRDTLFEPLVSGRAEGTGLGLALAREVARAHGGDLRYRSRPGETVFSLYLPLECRHDRP